MPATNRTQISYEKETSYKTPPASALQEIRMTSDSLARQHATAESDEIQATAQVSDYLLLDVTGQGDVAGEFSYGTYDDWMASAILDDDGAFSSDVVVEAASAVISFATSTITTSGTWDNQPPAGSVIRVEGSTSNDGCFNVVSSTTTTIVVGETLTTEGTGATIVITNLGRILNGTTLDTYFLQKHQQDETTLFQRGYGMAISGWRWEAPQRDKIQTSFSWFGSHFESASSTLAAVSAATTTPIMTGVAHFEKINVNSSAKSVISLSMQTAVDIRALTALGTLGATGLGLGALRITGNFRMYFETATEFDLFANHTAVPLFWQVEDENGDGYAFFIPSARITSATTPTPGKDQDVIGDFGWSARKDPTLLKTIMVAHYT